MSSLGEAAIPFPTPPLQGWWASAGPGYAGVGGTTLAPNTCASYPPVAPPGPAGLGNPGVTAPGLRRPRSWSLSMPWARAAAARASASSCLSFFLFVKKMIMQAIHASVIAPAMLDVITPILALSDRSSSSSSSESLSSSSLCARAVAVVYVDVEVGVGVIVVEYVNTIVPIVVVIVLVTVSSCCPSASHWASDTLSGVLVSEQDCCMLSYTWLINWALLPLPPKHLAESRTKSPLLPQRQSFISDTVLSEEQPEVSAACVRHDCAEAGYAEKSTSTEAWVGEVSRRT